MYTHIYMCCGIPGSNICRYIYILYIYILSIKNKLIIILIIIIKKQKKQKKNKNINLKVIPILKLWQSDSVQKAGHQNF